MIINDALALSLAIVLGFLLGYLLGGLPLSQRNDDRSSR